MTAGPGVAPGDATADGPKKRAIDTPARRDPQDRPLERHHPLAALRDSSTRLALGWRQP